MVISAISLENDVRRRYDRRVLFCIRIKGAALAIGLWDLLVHTIALCVLIFMFGHAPRTVTEISPIINDQHPSFADPYHDSSANGLVNRNSFANNALLNRFIEKHNLSHPSVDINARNFYTHLNIMTIRWARSLSQQDKFIVFFIVFSATILILAHICGVLTNKPSYIIPYFLIKVFNVIISVVSMLGFYAYLPDIKVWLRMQPEFPLKTYLLELDPQTLQLVLFTLILFVILAKLYIAAIIWYCYGYITALTMARTIGIVTTHNDIHHSIIGEMYSPPKYEEAIKSCNEQQEDCAPPPYTPLLAS